MTEIDEKDIMEVLFYRCTKHVKRLMRSMRLALLDVDPRKDTIYRCDSIMPQASTMLAMASRSLESLEELENDIIKKEKKNLEKYITLIHYYLTCLHILLDAYHLRRSIFEEFDCNYVDNYQYKDDLEIVDKSFARLKEMIKCNG